MEKKMEILKEFFYELITTVFHGKDKSNLF